MGVPARRVDVLYRTLLVLPHKNFGQLTPYNLLSPNEDRWGLSVQEGLIGWQKYGSLIEKVAIEQGIDPLILGAYVWTESDFDTYQYNRHGDMIAVGLASVQAQYHTDLGGSLENTIRLLQQNPYLNLTIEAKHFKACWNPQDMFGTIMDVWYPAWRKCHQIPGLGTAYAYVQLFSNRYFLLMKIMSASG